MRVFSFLILTLAADAQAKIKVVATLPDLAALAADVGGDLVDVDVLAAATIDPHYVDPRPSLILPLSRADLLIVNGLELEIGWLPPLINNSRNPSIHSGTLGYFDASSVVQRLGVPNHAIDRRHGDVHPGGNPHYTFDPRQGARIAAALGERLAKLDPANGASLRKRGEEVANELRQFAATEAAKFVVHGAKIVTYHDSLPYLCDWLGLTQVSTIEPRPGLPPTPNHVATVLDTIRNQRVNFIVQEEHHPRSTSQTLAKLGKAHLAILPTATRFTEGQSYIQHLKEITKEIDHAVHH